MALSREVVEKLIARKETVAAAESCTAGLAAASIAAIPGASGALWGSFVTYTADAKVRMLGVPEGLIEEHGAVSRPVAAAMAEKALEKSRASWAFSITGLAGPGGDSVSGTDNKSGIRDKPPIGTVWIGLARRDIKNPGSPRITAKKYLFSGSRNEVREAAVASALEDLLERINNTDIDRAEDLD